MLSLNRLYAKNKTTAKTFVWVTSRENPYQFKTKSVFQFPKLVTFINMLSFMNSFHVIYGHSNAMF